MIPKKFKFFEGLTGDDIENAPSDTYYRSIMIEDNLVRFSITTTSPEYLVDLIFDETFDESVELGLCFDLTAEHMLISLQNHFLYVERQR